MSDEKKILSGTHICAVNGREVRVRTENVCPPIPTRDLDWSAVDDNYEPGHAIGTGATEDAAIADLLEQLEEAED
jgi:hypothetical protein